MRTITINTTSWTYNPADLMTSMTYPDGEIVNFNYNNRMMLNSVIGNSSYVSSTSYDLAGRVTSRALGNGLSQNYAYNAWNTDGGRLQALTAGTLQNINYQYDNVGNITGITDTVASEDQSYAYYDALDRLTSASMFHN